MGKQTIKYIGLCMLIFLVLSVIEIFLLRPLIDFIGTDFWTHFIVYNVFLLLINPFATKYAINKFFDFKSEDIIEETIKAE